MEYGIKCVQNSYIQLKYEKEELLNNNWGTIFTLVEMVEKDGRKNLTDNWKERGAKFILKGLLLKRKFIILYNR